MRSRAATCRAVSMSLISRLLLVVLLQPTDTAEFVIRQVNQVIVRDNDAGALDWCVELNCGELEKWDTIPITKSAKLPFSKDFQAAMREVGGRQMTRLLPRREVYLYHNGGDSSRFVRLFRSTLARIPLDARRRI